MKFFKLGVVLLLAAFCVGILIPEMGCAADTRTVVDDRKVEVKIPANPKRVVTVCMPYAQIVWALDGSSKRLVGMHESAKVAAGISMIKKIDPKIMDVESGFTELSSMVVNVEELMKLNPDVVFHWTNNIKEIKKMEAAGLTVISATNQKDINEVPHRLRLVGEVLGQQKKAEEFIAEYRHAQKVIAQKTKSLPEDRKPMAIQLYSVDPLIVAPYPWYEAAGAKYPPVTNWNPISFEQILEWNPDIIFIGNFCPQMPDDILQNKIKGQEWSEVKAVKKGRVYKVPLGTYRWGPWNAESALMLWWVAKKQHPQLFINDYTIEQKIKEFYTKFISMTSRMMRLNGY